MNDVQTAPSPHHAAEGIATAVEKRRGFSFIWLVPLAALGLVLYLGYSALAHHGPEITLRFKTADGLIAHQTLLKYKSVPLGIVDDIDLGAAQSDVIVRVRTQRSAKFLLTDHARFWVVRPRITPASLSGLETLVTGAYISVDPGTRGGKEAREFIGLEEPPGVTSDEPGRTFDLSASRVGSLSEGSPVFYRDVTVGAMLKYELGDKPGPVLLRVFIRAPYDKLVHPDTLFWNASGVSLKTGSDGIHLELESIQALLSGGIAFETPEGGTDAPVGERPSPFHLYDGKAKADAALFRRNTPCVTYFQSSIEGLERGSAVRIFGVQVGAVSDVKLVFDPIARRFAARVAFDVQPERMLRPSEYQDVGADELGALAREGLHVAITSSNLLTGEKVLSLEYAPTSKPPLVTDEGGALVLPSEAGGGINEMATAMADIAAKLDKIPFEDIGNNLNGTLKSLNSAVGGPEMKNALASLSETMTNMKHLVREADSNLTPALAHLPAIAANLETAVQRVSEAVGENGYGANSDVQRSLARVLDQVGETARSVRLLADFLDHHPEALLVGRSVHAGSR